MCSVNGSTFHTKLQELLPNLPSSITPEILNKLCKDESVQPFLKWFYLNIKKDNVLSDECLKLKKHINKNDTWLQGKELDMALAEATKDCPELLKLIESDYWNGNQSFSDFTAEKELLDADLEYLQSLEDNIKKLKEYEEQIDIEIDKEDEILKKEEIKIKLTYENCLSILEELDSCSHQFFNAIELLSNTYVNAVQKKGEPCSWTQMPIELYIKQLETYNDYLISYTKRQFSAPQKDKNEISEQYDSFLSEVGENDKLKELLSCQQNLLTSKINEIIAKAEAEANKNLVNFVIDIYNNGNLKAPSTPVVARAEIAELTKTRDFLEENIYHLQERQLVDVVQQFSRARIIKVYEAEAEVRLERKKNRLSRLEKLSTLAKEHGHAFSTLLCMLFELQIHRINEIMQFVVDARHYLSMEYSLSTLRIESMQKLQNEYMSTLASPKDENAFCGTFMEMMSHLDIKDDIHACIQHYDELKNDNDKKIRILLDEKLNEMIESSKDLEKNVMNLYNQEINNSPTLSFTAIPCEIRDELDKTMKQVEHIETSVESMRNKFKTMIKDTSESSLEREKLLLWQKFLADPESLKLRCEELENLRDSIKF